MTRSTIACNFTNEGKFGLWVGGLDCWVGCVFSSFEIKWWGGKTLGSCVQVRGSINLGEHHEDPYQLLTTPVTVFHGA